MLVDSGPQLLEAALAGLGIGLVFGFLARDAIRDGAPVAVLPELAVDGPSIRAVWLPGTSERPRIRAFPDFAVESLSDLGG